MKMLLTVNGLSKLGEYADEILAHIEAINQIRKKMDAWHVDINPEIHFVDEKEGQ